MDLELHTFLTSKLHGSELSALGPGHFTPSGRAPITHWIGRWVGLRANVEAVVKRNIPNPKVW